MFDLVLKDNSQIRQVNKNLFVTNPYVSQAGNAYFNALRVAEGLIQEKL
jgi:hypothetical protein